MILLGALLLILKLAGVISWSWYIVLIPFAFTCAVALWLIGIAVVNKIR